MAIFKNGSICRLCLEKSTLHIVIHYEALRRWRQDLIRQNNLEASFLKDQMLKRLLLLISKTRLFSWTMVRSKIHNQRNKAAVASDLSLHFHLYQKFFRDRYLVGLQEKSKSTALVICQTIEFITPPYVKLNGRFIECLHRANIHFDECLNFEKHINYITGKN